MRHQVLKMSLYCYHFRKIIGQIVNKNAIRLPTRKIIAFLLEKLSDGIPVYRSEMLQGALGQKGALNTLFGSERLQEPHDRGSEGAQNFSKTAPSEMFQKHFGKYPNTRYLALLGGGFYDKFIDETCLKQNDRKGGGMNEKF